MIGSWSGVTRTLFLSTERIDLSMIEDSILTVNLAPEEIIEPESRQPMICFRSKTYVIGDDGIQRLLKMVDASWKCDCEFKLGNVVFRKTPLSVT